MLAEMLGPEAAARKRAGENDSALSDGLVVSGPGLGLGPGPGGSGSGSGGGGDAPRSTVSHTWLGSGSRRSPLSSGAVSAPVPQLTRSTSPSRASSWSLPAAHANGEQALVKSA